MSEVANPRLSSDLAAWHFLSRTTFGPQADEMEKVKQLGIKSLLEEQLHPENIDDSAVEQKIAALPTLTMSPAELMEDFPARKQRKIADPTPERPETQPSKPDDPNAMPKPAGPGMSAMEPDGPRLLLMELGRAQLWRAAYSRRQLQEVMVQFWMNHFNIYAGKGVDRWLMTSFEHDTIRPHALGNFGDLLAATAQSPAMLFYLDNWLSVAPDAPAPALLNRQKAKRLGLNENYARELMELHTLGVDGGYTQQDVREVARCFTGWTINRPRQGGGFIFRPLFHDVGEKTVLGHKIEAAGGVEDGTQVLQILAAHPSTAHFISLKLCRHFVADEPPASIVDRATHTFIKSSGDIRAVLATILTSQEFNSPEAFRAKVKSPFELAASSLRCLDAETDGSAPMLGLIVKMGQPLFFYQAPTGFPDRANNWINTGTLLARMNFSMALAANKIPGTQLDLQALTPSEDSQAVWSHLVQRTLGGSVSDQTQSAVMKSLDELNKVGTGIPIKYPETTLMAALLVGSPEFQRK
jgi:uncharacterized protein (DUF1800 family)